MRGAGLGRPPVVASLPVSLHVTILVAFSAISIVAWATPAGASSSELREAGERYAANDPRAALAVLGKVISRKGKTAWVAEALYMRARILARDMGEHPRALRDLRLLTVRFAGAEAAAFGQFGIARIYEAAGLPADAYREYTLCSRLRGIPDVRSAARLPVRRQTGSRTAKSPVRSGRITPEGAAGLVRLAAERAALLFGRVPPGGVPAGVGLPPRTFVATGPTCALEVPADPRGKPASGERSDVWYVVAPRGRSISCVTARFEAVVDPAAAGSDDKKFYRMLVERLPRGPAAALALHGVRTRAQELRGRLVLPEGAGAVRVTVLRSGARVLRCRMNVDVRDAPPSPPKAPGAPKGFAFAAAPGGAGMGGAVGAGGADLARAGGRIFLVWHSPGQGSSSGPAGDADLYISSSPDGATWTAPARLSVSSAMDDRAPSLGGLPGGRLLLAWTSDRRGPGMSDIYTAESPDGVKWSKPARLGIDPRDLDSMGPRMISSGTGVPSAVLTLHRPEVSVDSKGVARVFFVAHGIRYIRTGNRTVARLGATGVYGVVSTGAGRWSKPASIISTPITPLDRFRPAPKTREREVVSPLARPAVIERAPGRSLVGWVSTCGRVFLTRRGPTGKWTHHDTRFAGAEPAQAAAGIEILGPVNDTYGVLLLRSDLTPKLVWRDKSRKEDWRVEDVEAGVPPGAFSEVTAVPLAGGRSWLTAWTGSGAAGPGGICVREIVAPPAPPLKKKKKP